MIVPLVVILMVLCRKAGEIGKEICRTNIYFGFLEELEGRGEPTGATFSTSQVFLYQSVPRKGLNSRVTRLLGRKTNLLVLVILSGRTLCQLGQHHLERRRPVHRNVNVANVRSSRQGAKKLQFLSGCNF